MGSLDYDSRSGALVEGLIWEFPVAVDLQAAMKGDRVYGEWTGKERSEELFQCPVSRQHKTGTRTLEVEIDLFGGPHLGDFLPLTNHGFRIVSDTFSERLRRSGLKGFAIREGVRVGENQSGAKAPKFFFLDVVGKGGTCRRWRVKDAPNSCPYCGHEPVICPGCGWCSQYGCLACGKRIWYDGGDPGDADGRRLLYGGYPKTLIVEGKDWDGSDWFAVEGHGGDWFVNRRAREWFERVHVLDAKFKPALLNLEGMPGVLPDGTRIA
jgi:hypothetical protein